MKQVAVRGEGRKEGRKEAKEKKLKRIKVRSISNLVIRLNNGPTFLNVKVVYESIITRIR